MNLVQRIAGAARLLATGKLASSTGFGGAQMQRRLVPWRAGGDSINSLILQGGELQPGRARQLVRISAVAITVDTDRGTVATLSTLQPSRHFGVLPTQAR